MVDILIVNYNTKELIKPMIEACVAAHQKMTPRYLVVDNASTDGSLGELQKFGLDQNLIVNKNNVGFGRANNQLLPLIKNDYILLLNTDAFIQPNALVDSIAFMERNKECGILGVKLICQDGEVQPSCRYFPSPFNIFLQRTGLSRLFRQVQLIDDPGWDSESVSECDWVPGCFYFIRREVIDEIGLFDPSYFLYYEEVDHCKRAKAAGWKVMYSPHTAVVHIGGESAKHDGRLSSKGRQLSILQVESEILFLRKHYGFIGIALHAILSLAADIYIELKNLIKRTHQDVSREFFPGTARFFRILICTKFGRMPTR